MYFRRRRATEMSSPKIYEALLMHPWDVTLGGAGQVLNFSTLVRSTTRNDERITRALVDTLLVVFLLLVFKSELATLVVPLLL